MKPSDTLPEEVPQPKERSSYIWCKFGFVFWLKSSSAWLPRSDNKVGSMSTAPDGDKSISWWDKELGENMYQHHKLQKMRV